MGKPIDAERLDHLLGLERLSDTLADRPGGELFQADLEEARALAGTDPRFEQLVEGLEAETLGERLGAVTEFFDRFPARELASLDLPPHLSQLRFIYLSAHPDWPSGGS